MFNPTEVERLMLMSIKTPDDVAQIQANNGITRRNFSLMPNEAQFVFEYIDEFGRAPDEDTFSLSFPDFKFSEGSSNLAYIADEFNKEIIRREAIAIYGAFTKPGGILEQDARTGIIDLGNKIDSLRARYLEVNTTHRRALDGEAALKRYDSYVARMNGEKENTFGLGIEPLDYLLSCRRGNLIGIYADTGGGKSFFALRTAAEFNYRGERVVVISPELSVNELSCRCDSVLAYQMGYRTISNLALLEGTPGPPGMAEDYQEFLGRLGDDSSWINYANTIEGEVTVSAVESIIMTDEPTLVVVDGIYMMTDEKRGNSSWEKVHNLCYGLKNLATKHNVVILMTQQATRAAGADYKLPEKSELADGYSFARSADILISAGKVEDNDKARQVGVKKLRSGSEIYQTFKVTYDVDIGDIGRDLQRVSQATASIHDY